MSSASDGRPAKKVTHTEAARILAARDPVIARMVAETGLPRFSRPQETHFATLVRAIVYQQLAGSAAAAINGRLIAALGGEAEPAGWSRCLTRRCARPACPGTRPHRYATSQRRSWTEP